MPSLKFLSLATSAYLSTKTHPLDSAICILRTGTIPYELAGCCSYRLISSVIITMQTPQKGTDEIAVTERSGRAHLQTILDIIGRIGGARGE